METSKNINRDIIIGACLIAFSLFFLYESSKIHPGAAEFPKIVLVVFLVLSALLVVNGILNTVNPSRMKKSDAKIAFREVKPPVFILLITVVYIVLIDIVGFFVATTAAVPAIMLFFGIRRLAPILIVTAALDVFVYVLFVVMLNVYLP